MRARRSLPALLLIAWAPCARADFKDTYRKALEAVDRKRWPEVVELMREAIAQNPREGEKVKLYGMRFETYLPHFHLGMALSQTGECAGALRAFEASESQGAVRSTPVYTQLVDARAACQKLAGPATPPPRPSAPPATAPPAPPPTPALTPTPPPPTPPPPTPSAAPSRPPPSPSPTPTRMPPPTPTPRPLPTPSAPPAPASLRPGPAPPELVRAAEAYFSGRYDEAAGLLERIPGLSGRPAAQAHLLRAAARFALFRIGGERDAALRQRALEDVAACRRADPELAPDPEAFPPPFAELFRGGR